MKRSSILARIATVSAALCLSMPLAGAAEIEAGTVLDASNIDALLGRNLDGKPLETLLTERMQWMIRNEGMSMRLANARPIEVDADWVRMSEANAKTVDFDPATRTVINWVAGLPFPKFDQDDPHAGDKVAWNARYALLEGYSIQQPYVVANLINLDRGVERIQNVAFERVMMAGRTGPGAGSPTLGDGSIFSKTVNFLTYPIDVRGTGLYAQRYMDPDRADDKWVYVRQLRRVKRVSGGGWMDPIGGGMDMLVEDLNVWDTPPHWYPSVTLKGKRWVLAVAHAEEPLDPTKRRQAGELRMYDLANPPYTNTLNAWEPREVYELEVIPSEEHPYGRRVIYIDAQLFQAFHSEIYDKRGDFWKYISYDRAPFVGNDGFKGYAPMQGRFIDFKRRTATVTGGTWVGNSPDVNERTITLQSLERASAR